MTRSIQASDLTTLLECDRRVFLNYHGDPARRVEIPPYDRWLMQEGRAFETAVADVLGTQKPVYPITDREEGFAATLALMRAGVPAISQGVLMDNDLVGMPDLLLREDGVSALGDHHYRPADVKLAQESRPGHRLQVMAYARLLEAVQGLLPEGALFLRLPADERGPDRLYREEPVPFDGAALDAKLAEVRGLAGGSEPRPFISSVCGGCPWREVCLPLAEQAGDISLVPGLQRRVWSGLQARGLDTLAALGAASPDDLLDLPGVGEKTAPRIVRQARALAEGRSIPIAPPDLPPPALDEVFFDIESVPAEGITYLMGTLVQGPDGPAFVYDLAEHPDDEPHMWEAFLARMSATSGPVYHYGAYERSAIRALAARHGEDWRVDHLQGRLVDLAQVLKDSVALPLRGYSLKEVAPWLGFARSGETQAGGDSMLEYLAWLEDGDRVHLERILHYNRDDLEATRLVRDWLLTQRGGRSNLVNFAP